ncbi:MAG: prephenate dehydrogenase/arogenate dehydrogenase family protein [Treponema sp.]|jgi:prephenate dehydrogenase|nr:prephenate dehydrogenase/arogenate dehydrogenase family protein [Treponema sp.]
MKPIEDSTLGILGLGLMGGALAMALRNRTVLGPRGRLLAHDIDPGTLEAARAEGLIDGGFPSPGEMLGRCDVVFLCLNPSTLLRFMAEHMALFRPGALITDIAGIKGNIAAAMERDLREDLDFIPGHPMAGSEKGGFAQAGSCNFQGKNYILTPLKRNKPENLEFLKDLICRMGFGRITCTTAEEHDRKIAFTSQLCHVIAAALIDCESDRAITRFGGGSFEDLTRIAMLNAPMWTELFLENRRELLDRIKQFEGSLDKLKNFIAAGAREELLETLGAVRERRAAMG